VTQTLAEARHHIVVVGAPTSGQSARDALQAAGTDFVIGKDLQSSVFDDDTDTWVLTNAAGDRVRADVVIATGPPPYVPWIPDIAGRNDFRGDSFHAAAWDPDFDPAGKHIAVIGTDAAAGHCLRRLAESAASVTVFAHPPRRFVTEIPLASTRAKRWLRRRLRLVDHEGVAATLAGSAIEALTASGLRTSDGVEYRVDAVIYGTGFTVGDRASDQTLVGTRGLTLRQAWSEGMEPCFGVAVRGFPNYFFITGPDIDAQTRLVVGCLNLMKRTMSTRVEVRASSQQVFTERAQLRPAPVPAAGSAFDLSSGPADDFLGLVDTYRGAATLTVSDACHPVYVRLTGHVNPIDGRYHWQGTVFDSPAQPLPVAALQLARTVTLTVGERSAPARVVEQTPWGTHSVAGVGAPPYALN